MPSEHSPRNVRFSNGEEDARAELIKSPRSSAIAVLESSNSLSSAESPNDDPHAAERHDELPALSVYDPVHAGSMTSLVQTALTNGTSRSMRSSTGDLNGGHYVAVNGSSLKSSARPGGPARTPSSTYAPQRRPQPAPSFIESVRSSRSRPRPSERFRQQERAYVQRLRQDYGDGYPFDGYTNGMNQGDSDSEGETPSSEGPYEDRYEQETIMFYGNDDLQPTDEDVKDPANRERLEWYGMLEAVLTGDVVRQEKKRLIGSGEPAVGESAQKNELWLGIRSKLPGTDQLSPQGIDFLKGCFLQDPKKRMSAVELLQHEWIMTIRNQVVEPATPSDGSVATPASSVSRANTGDGFY
ncbi:hypothetical protein BN1723_001016 [Verticillium longisporum]|uniref:Protein kinase domain-containing protein n=1 Tax=Verticillium longisporum TaxID=100787 RepID=A0A0G4NGZ2_VERLO|nr:hypothetical protein BN1723_001016 [Verticillium longisporum]